MRDTYGEDVFCNPRRATNIMNDLCPHMPQERIQVKNFIEMNGYLMLKHAGSDYPLVHDKLVDTYKGTYLVDDDTARWVVDIFSELTGYIQLDIGKPGPPQKAPKDNQGEGDASKRADAGKRALEAISGYRKQAAGYETRVVNQPEIERSPDKPIDTENLATVIDENLAALVSSRLARRHIQQIGSLRKAGITPAHKVKNPKPVVFAQLTSAPPPTAPQTLKYLHRRIAADYHTVAIKEDGTVIASGLNNAGQCNVLHWFDVVSVAAGSGFTVALRGNGTVVAAGRNEFGQCNVGRWQNIVAISAGARHTLGIRADSTVVATGENRYGECNVTGWRNITAIFGGNQCTYGVKSDKHVLARGYNKNMDYDTSMLSDVICVADANPYGALALRSDGTLVKARQSMKGDFSRIHSLVDLVSTPDCFVGLRRNGTVRVIAYYWESSGVECAPDDWSDVCEISAGRYHIIGLKRDGTLYAAMLHTNKALNKGQCDVELWSGIKT
jgi:alpha-tubulin suppressor-like RCC1 family protein